MAAAISRRSMRQGEGDPGQQRPLAQRTLLRFGSSRIWWGRSDSGHSSGPAPPSSAATPAPRQDRPAAPAPSRLGPAPSRLGPPPCDDTVRVGAGYVEGHSAGPPAAASGPRLDQQDSLGGASAASAGAGSAASAGGSAAGRPLLRWLSRSLSRGSHRSAADSQQAEQAQPQSVAQRWLKRVKRWVLHYILRPVFGYDPSQQGEWVPEHGYDVRRAPACCHCRGAPGPPAHCTASRLALFVTLSPQCLLRRSFVARFGVVFETARGPKVQWRPGTFEFDQATGRFDRGGMVPTASTRAARVRDTCKVRRCAKQHQP